MVQKTQKISNKYKAKENIKTEDNKRKTKSTK